MTAKYGSGIVVRSLPSLLAAMSSARCGVAAKPVGRIIVAMVAEDGLSPCNGLPVLRYSAPQLHAVIGALFTLVRHENDEHRTPSGTLQQFVYCHFRKSSS